MKKRNELEYFENMRTGVDDAIVRGVAMGMQDLVTELLIEAEDRQGKRFKNALRDILKDLGAL